jgi:DNA-directed RNA polymerase specialized sigma24 family protein
METATTTESDITYGSDALRERIDLLRPNDRLLLELTMRGNYSRRRIGKVLNLEPGSVSRRLRRLIGRLNDPLVSRLLDSRCPLPPDYRQIGVEHFLSGWSTTELAGKHGMTVIQMRQIVQYLRGWSRGAGAID